MFQRYNIKGWIKWPLVRAHLCTLAVSVGLNSTWRAPREAFRYGGLQFALAATAASLVVLPLTLLQLALGQLSQQDVVGVWRAIPFFKGVGYLRLLVSALGCAYSVVYAALAAAYFVYTLSNHIPFRACSDPRLNEEGYDDIINSSSCLNATFLAPISQKPEYFIAMTMIICFIWIVPPFLLYSPVKLMKRTFYLLGPIIVVMGLVIASSIGSWGNLASFHLASDWRYFVEPRVWVSALAQALLSAQVAGGFLVSAGDAVYSTTNVQWTAIALVGTNIASLWCGLLFWFTVGGGTSTGLDAGAAAALEQAYRVAYEDRLDVAWPLAIFATIFLSGVITMLTFLYPLVERTRRAGGARWRAWCAGGCAAGAAASLAALAGRWPALALLEDTAVPLLACLATVVEVLAFVFIYGWKVLMEDVEFLTGQTLSKFWMMGWCAAPGVVAPFAVWWAVAAVASGEWATPPWTASGAVAAVAVTLLIVLVFAAEAVARQVQYDIFGKLKSSFRPSRHWGPRDPIAHYYWLARRDAGLGEGPGGAGVGPPARRYRRRQPGQLSGSPGFFDVTVTAPSAPAGKDINSNEVKRRSHSDDWIYTVYRRKYLEEAFSEYLAKSRKVRSMSLDWAQIPRVRQKKNFMELKVLSKNDFNDVVSVGSVESVKGGSKKKMLHRY